MSEPKNGAAQVCRGPPLPAIAIVAENRQDDDEPANSIPTSIVDSCQRDVADIDAQTNPSENHNPTEDAAQETRDPISNDAEPKDRFDALVRDRDSLRAEVTDMRKSLEEIQSRHKADMKSLQQKLEDSETKKEQAETQFQNLLERVNTIKSQLGQRMKEDAVR